MDKWPEKYPVVVAMIPPATYLVAVSKTEGYVAQLAGRIRFPVKQLGTILAMSGNEFEELPDYDYSLIPEIEALPVEGPPT
jgi:hypothetical protein